MLCCREQLPAFVKVHVSSFFTALIPILCHIRYQNVMLIKIKTMG